MGYKLEDNGLWESSRMILPEHRSRIIRNSKEQDRREKPTLAEEEIQVIAAVVAQSYHQEVEATFDVFNPFEHKEIRGVVTKVDQQLRRFRVGEHEWVNFSEVIKAR
ncbi:YolD-like family protein [Paenibacillus sp. 32352]|uniref:YolD-like family protein n=1 Tax=Paenibacillus sp. 32352 TaxID=1969111 RepID=UPI0009ABED1F|nr:YolD-like family protein [Paenibacillus sp. 32352]